MTAKPLSSSYSRYHLHNFTKTLFKLYSKSYRSHIEVISKLYRSYIEVISDAKGPLSPGIGMYQSNDRFGLNFLGSLASQYFLGVFSTSSPHLLLPCSSLQGWRSVGEELERLWSGFRAALERDTTSSVLLLEQYMPPPHLEVCGCKVSTTFPHLTIPHPHEAFFLHF